jgi:hypothetical protein
VANKVCALFGRAEVRDYVDVDAILTSGRYTGEESLGLAADHDPGFDQLLFAEALAAIDRLPDSTDLTPVSGSGVCSQVQVSATRPTLRTPCPDAILPTPCIPCAHASITWRPRTGQTAVQLTWIKMYVRVHRSRDAGVPHDLLQHLRRVPPLNASARRLEARLAGSAILCAFRAWLRTVLPDPLLIGLHCRGQRREHEFGSDLLGQAEGL